MVGTENWLEEFLRVDGTARNVEEKGVMNAMKPVASTLIHYLNT